MNRDLMLRNLGGVVDSILIPMPDDYEMQGWAYDTSNWFTSGTHETYPTQIFQKCKDIQINGKKYTFKDDTTLDDYFIISLTADGYSYQTVQNRAIGDEEGNVVYFNPHLWTGNKIDDFSSSDLKTTGQDILDTFLKDCGLNSNYNNIQFLFYLYFVPGSSFIMDGNLMNIDLSRYSSDGIPCDYTPLAASIAGQYRFWIELLLE